MSTAIQKSIIQKARDFLNITNEGGATELYTLLRKYCDEINPERYQNDGAKEAAEKKYAEAQDLISELVGFIEDEAAHRTPAELILYKPSYDHVLLQQALDHARKEIDDLKQQLEWRENEVEELKAHLKKKDDERFEEERRRLEKMYKPSTTNLASLGIIVLLSALLATMTKVKEVSDFISQYSPFSESTMKTTLFVILILMVLLTVKRYVENLALRRRVQDVCSARFSVEFVSYLTADLDDPGQLKQFTESNAFDFVAGKPSRWKSILSRIGFPTFQTRTYELLKNCFINHLIQKELIEISYAHELDRTFSIKSRSRYW
jgi:flagellar motility protein MotE (MotC chaperone)